MAKGLGGSTLVLFLLLMFTTADVRAQPASGVTFQVVHSFTGGATDGGDPHAGLIQGTDRNFYGTTVVGGTSDGGTVFRMTADGTVTVLHSFSGLGTDGRQPESELLQGQDGNLYGMTPNGGSAGHGAVFTITPSGTYTTLHSFAGGSADGANPLGALIQTADGLIYGTTSEGGSSSLGTVFKMTTSGVVTILHSFVPVEGGGSRAALLPVGDGLYGTTTNGLFRITVDGSFTLLRSFTFGPGGPFGLPNQIKAPLIQASDGNFYGTSQSCTCLSTSNPGTIFRMAPDGSATVLQSIRGTTEPLLASPDRRLYGTAEDIFNDGTVFQMTLGGQLTTLYAFRSGNLDLYPDGRYPQAPLMRTADGAFYGTTAAGGSAGKGVIFRLTLSTPAAPTGLHVETSSSGIPVPWRLLSWNAVSGATTYTIKRGSSAGSEVVLATGVVGTVFEDRTAVAGTATYYYVVSADNGLTEGPGSNEVSISPHVTAPGDFDGDGKTDLTVFRPSTGGWWVLKSGGNFTTNNAYGWGLPGDLPESGDYDGDGKPDIAIYRPSTGYWWILWSSTNYSTYNAYGWGVGGDVPVPADYDGDGKTDIAIYRPTTGEWWIVKSSAGFTTYSVHTWGSLGDVPVVGDYDGDGISDPAIFRPSTGNWWILNSSTNYTIYNQYGWGVGGDVPVAADYDGDGKADPAVYRPTTGEWWILKSSTGFTAYGAYGWGMPGDVPVLGDFDSDGRTDIAIYRPATGGWWILNSGTNFTTVQSYYWGFSTDLPLLWRP